MNHKIVDKIVCHKNVHKIGVESCVTSCIMADRVKSYLILCHYENNCVTYPTLPFILLRNHPSMRSAYLGHPQPCWQTPLYERLLKFKKSWGNFLVCRVFMIQSSRIQYFFIKESLRRSVTKNGQLWDDVQNDVDPSSLGQVRHF